MFYIEWKGVKFTDIHELTLKDVIELLNQLKDSKLKWEEKNNDL